MILQQNCKVESTHEDQVLMNEECKEGSGNYNMSSTECQSMS